MFADLKAAALRSSDGLLADAVGVAALAAMMVAILSLPSLV